MANKKNQFSFGIFQDGLTVKIAELVLIDGSIKVLRLGKTELSAPLYPAPPEVRKDYTSVEEIEEKEETKKDEESFDELEQLSKLEDLEISEDSVNITDQVAVLPEDAGLDIDQEEAIHGRQDLQKLLQSLPLHKGKIALSVNDEQVSYHQFDSAFASSRLRKKLKSEILSKEEIKSKNYALDYIINPNGSGLAFVHRGPLELLTAVQEINPVITKQKFIYSHLDTNEITLMGLVNNCYEFPPEDFVTILYIGNDYKVGIVMKDKNHIKTFPIIITETDPEKKRQAIYSKIILEQDISNTPITQHVILAGEDVSDEDVAFYQEKGFYWDPLKRLTLPDLELVEKGDEESAEEKIAQYAIPIGLAWKALEPKNPNFYASNLLPSRIIENQKYFKIAWHGYLVLLLMFYFALSGTLKHLELKQQILEIQRKTALTQSELQEVRRKIAAVNAVKNKISEIENKNEIVKTITGTKNQWHYIMKGFSESFMNNKITWIDNLSADEKSFGIKASTSRRRNIIEFSSLFAENEISQISPIFIEDIPVWEFNMTYSYLDPDAIKTDPKVITTIEKEAKNQTALDKDITEDEIILVYRSIINIYFNGNYNDAYDRFVEFRKLYPNHKRAYNAKYFTGECLYLKGQISEAKQIFHDIVAIKGTKTPDAYMMLGNCYNKENDFEQAKFFWNKLVMEYPANELAPLAAYKIQNL
jgi:TolA-binding protein